MFPKAHLGTALLFLALCLTGCSTTSPKPAEVAAPTVVYATPPADVYAAACNRVVLKDGLTNEGLALAFKEQDKQLKECTDKVKKAVADWEAKQPGTAAAPKKPRAYITECALWEKMFFLCSM